MKLRWISNTYDPRRGDAKLLVSRFAHETMDEAWERYTTWLKGKILATPEATEKYAVLELIEMGMVGVYIPEEED